MEQVRARQIAQTIVLASLAWLAGLAPAEAARAVDQKQCRALAQRYDETKAGASTLEVNNFLFSAARRGCKGLAERLLMDGASLQARDRFGAMPLGTAAEEGWVELVELFLSRGAPIDARDTQGQTALFRAVEADRHDVIRILLAHGADHRIPGRKGNSVIAAAAYRGSAAIVALLLKQGSDANIIDELGKSPICYAAGRGWTDVTRLLLDGGVDVNARYGNGLTALMWAAGYSEDAGYLDALKTIDLLVARGAYLDDKDNRGRTALMIAAELGHDEVLEALLRLGADPRLTDNDGKTAVELAATDVVRQMLRRN